MDTLLAAAMIGELLSWVGFGLAAPFLLIGVIIRLVDGGWVPTDVAVSDDEPRTAHWTVGDRAYSRELDDHELERLDDEPVQRGFTTRNRPSSMRFEPHRPLARAMLIVGGVLLAVGVVGTALSFLPLLG